MVPVEGAVIAPDDPRADDVRRLIEAHLEHARVNTPPEDIHAFDIDGLLEPGISLFGLRVDGELLGIGAIRRLDRHHGELKSMHTAAAARRRGVGRAMLDHLLAVAAERGMRRVSLETGSWPGFAPSRALYAEAGFRPCGPFGDHRAGTSSVFMTLELAPDDEGDGG